MHWLCVVPKSQSQVELLQSKLSTCETTLTFAAHELGANFPCGDNAASEHVKTHA